MKICNKFFNCVRTAGTIKKASPDFRGGAVRVIGLEPTCLAAPDPKQLPAILAKMEIDSRQQAERDAERKRWHEEYEMQARIRREYIGAMEQDAIARGGVSEKGQTWLDWARGKIDWYDPLVEKEDEFLREVDRENLTFKR